MSPADYHEKPDKRVRMKVQRSNHIYYGESELSTRNPDVTGEYISMAGEVFYKITHYDALEPFFISLISSSNHWMFIASTGGLSAGRVNPEGALFPYYSVDKLTENNENTGAKTIFLVTRDGRTSLWEPFTCGQPSPYSLERVLYKNKIGTSLIFEEINLSLGLIYRYAWCTGDAFGFIKTSWLSNMQERICQVELLDGVQNILPANVSSTTQNIFSSLLDAYKRSELHPATGLGIFALNSTLTDLAEPSESLLATTVWQVGLEPLGYLLSSAQLDAFRHGRALDHELEVRGQRGGYFVHSELELAAESEHSWHLVAEVNQDASAITQLESKIIRNHETLAGDLDRDIARNEATLEWIAASADGLQISSEQPVTTHHFTNVMFNNMRGGFFADQYQLHKADLLEFISVRNRLVLEVHAGFFSSLPEEMSIFQLGSLAKEHGSADLVRLVHSFLPLSFSRRHGDPSRPWNRFSIDIKHPDGRRKLGYEGNWRDIFQNWEALAASYPGYVENMICTFLNATTVDGYNPYRISNQEVDWEVPEPGNPWANIGYWGDHQVIYLVKLMELSDRFFPGQLLDYLSLPVFSYTNVPYRIQKFEDLVNNPYKTIVHDRDLEQKIAGRVLELGTDGRLVFTPDGQVLHGTLTDKLLSLLLAKMSNFVAEGGIWMNTQRPEWNDANNALVGKGLSVVTLGYLRRMVVFFMELLEKSPLATLQVSKEIHAFFLRVFQALIRSKDILKGVFTDEQRASLLEELGRAGSDYRWEYYQTGLSGETTSLSLASLLEFLELVKSYLDHSLRANRRSDDLYHAYNILHLRPGRCSVSHLDEMLEGQVAILSSGLLSGAESLRLLESLENSRLYLVDQDSYLLYPDRKLAGFIEKNSLSADLVKDIPLVLEMANAGDTSLLLKDVNGVFHFSGTIHNLKNVSARLEALATQPRFKHLISKDGSRITQLFEALFHHDQFTGRSGTFFAYEGLGSIYWHMVSKLLLAVLETIFRCDDETIRRSLVEKYNRIRSGLGFIKSPAKFGAFPSDPYSHTPGGHGARQPGMTGAVKEEILTRQGELGYTIREGRLAFDFRLLDRSEFLPAPEVFDYWDVGGQARTMDVPAGSMAYTICQVPVILCNSQPDRIQIHWRDGSIQDIPGHSLDDPTSRRIFQRDNTIQSIKVFC